jgi:hypothetical protein
VLGVVYLSVRGCVSVLGVVYLCVRGRVSVCYGSCICVLGVHKFTTPNSLTHKFTTTNTQILHDRSLSRLDTGASIKKSDGVKLVLLAQIFPLSEIMQSWKSMLLADKYMTVHDLVQALQYKVDL